MEGHSGVQGRDAVDYSDFQSQPVLDDVSSPEEYGRGAGLGSDCFAVVGDICEEVVVSDAEADYRAFGATDV